MSKQSINHYYNKLHQYKTAGHTRNESSMRRAFANLLEEYCETKKLTLVDELVLKNSTKRPDGTIKDANGILAYGHWESKDTKDKLDDEIDYKFSIGYPQFNIIFENTEEIVLIQQGEEKMRGQMEDANFLHRILTEFISYEHPEITKFNKAVDQFKENIPDIVEALRSMIEKQTETNKKFIAQREIFWEVCRNSINPEISAFDIREMLIQHILTAEIFDTVFNESHFHRENNIAIELEKVINTFFIKEVRKNTLAQIDSYYKAIKAEAARITNHHDKQQFLKVIYENFYKAYNPKGADKLGVVYTPNEIVHFMVESTDYLLEKHFNKNLADKNVDILDPATGTGTFITEIIEYIPPKYLKHKFLNEIHCNELAILPYYIANLNIEYTYQQKMNEYQSFEHIVFVDTLDNLGFGYAGKQQTMFAMSTENLDRIKNQNSKKISVIIGNPPYNARQPNYNDFNANKKYQKIDENIKNTYIKHGTAQNQIVLYDMFTRFLRWSSDRIDKNGIIAFVTNNAFIDAKAYDGFRKVIGNEFNEIYIINLKGNARTSGERRQQEAGNVFDDKIRVGVAIYFLVKNENLKGFKVYYDEVDNYLKSKQKIQYLIDNKLKNIPFDNIQPDKKNNWINLTDNDFEDLIPLINKDVKAGKSQEAVLKLFSLGIASHRDEWVYDFSKENLKNKVSYMIDIYQKNLKDNNCTNKETIAWDRELRKYNDRKIEKKFSKKQILYSLFRPYTKKSCYLDKHLIGMPYQAFSIYGNEDNVVISVNREGNNKPFHFIATNNIADLHTTGDSQCLPLYRFDKEGNRIENITDWGLKQFQEHYGNKARQRMKAITKEGIFHYTYGVLHNPAYRKKYELNLKREFPRLPFYSEFWKWANWGKELMDLHINYETVKPYKLKIHEEEKQKENPKAKLRRDKETNEIILDENTTIKGIPAIAFDYKLGNRSAIDWILDQHKEKKYSKKTMKKYPDKRVLSEKFNTYRFADYKETVIDLIKRVTTVSVRTMEITNQMEAEEPHLPFSS